MFGTPNCEMLDSEALTTMKFCSTCVCFTRGGAHGTRIIQFGCPMEHPPPQSGISRQGRPRQDGPGRKRLLYKEQLASNDRGPHKLADVTTTQRKVRPNLILELVEVKEP